MWVRGLKRASGKGGNQGTRVAPYVGAWIETSDVTYRQNEVKVAPYVGAWIETL